MSSDLFLGAYWQARKESIEHCADRLKQFIVNLITCDPMFATWYEKGRSRKKALQKPVDVGNREYLLSLLDKGRHRNIDRKVMEDIGFSFGLWNGGNDGKDVSLLISCGSFSASVGNSVVLNLPEDLGELKLAKHMVRVLAATVRAWDPEWAGVISNEAMNARDWDRKPFVDWMVYVPRRIENVPPPSSIVKVENGSLIVVQPDPPDINNVEAQECISKIVAILQK